MDEQGMHGFKVHVHVYIYKLCTLYVINKLRGTLPNNTVRFVPASCTTSVAQLVEQCHGFESHLRQLIFLGEKSSSGSIELCCVALYQRISKQLNLINR